MKILHIDSSARYADSISRELSAFFNEKIIDNSDGYEYLDLGLNPPQTITALHSIAMYTPEEERTPAMQAALKSSDDYVDQLLKADTIIIGAPMYNFGIPASLKLYFDMVIRIGRTFVPNGSGSYDGMLKGKHIVIIGSFGGDYREGTPMAWMNNYESHLRAMLSFIGADQPHFVIAQPTQFGGIDQKEIAVQQCKVELTAIATKLFSYSEKISEVSHSL